MNTRLFRTRLSKGNLPRIVHGSAKALFAVVVLLPVFLGPQIVASRAYADEPSPAYCEPALYTGPLFAEQRMIHEAVFESAYNPQTHWLLSLQSPVEEYACGTFTRTVEDGWPITESYRFIFFFVTHIADIRTEDAVVAPAAPVPSTAMLQPGHAVAADSVTTLSGALPGRVHVVHGMLQSLQTSNYIGLTALAFSFDGRDHCYLMPLARLSYELTNVLYDAYLNAGADPPVQLFCWGGEQGEQYDRCMSHCNNDFIDAVLRAHDAKDAAMKSAILQCGLTAVACIAAAIAAAALTVSSGGLGAVMIGAIITACAGGSGICITMLVQANIAFDSALVDAQRTLDHCRCRCCINTGGSCTGYGYFAGLP